jgi:hypothetical protein
MATDTPVDTPRESKDAKAVEVLIQYIWNIESHHWTCPQCHAISEIEECEGLKIPEHPHLKKLRRRRKELLRRQLVKEGQRVGGIRAENEMLLTLLNDTAGTEKEFEADSEDADTELQDDEQANEIRDALY